MTWRTPRPRLGLIGSREHAFFWLQWMSQEERREPDSGRAIGPPRRSDLSGAQPADRHRVRFVMTSIEYKAHAAQQGCVASPTPRRPDHWHHCPRELYRYSTLCDMEQKQHGV